jgi:hypothetical protein
MENENIDFIISGLNIWEWVVLTEVALRLNYESHRITFYKIDCNPHKRNKVIENYQFVQEVCRHMNARGISVITLKSRPKRVKAARVFLMSRKTLRQSKTWKNIYPTLVDSLGLWNIRRSNLKNIVNIYRETLKSDLIRFSLETRKLEFSQEIFIANGRYTGSSTIKTFAEENNKVLNVVDFGANKYRFRISPGSAQSIKVTESQTRETWENANRINRETIAHEYFRNKMKADPSTGISWTANMRKGLLPKLDPKKKVCVLYATSQVEFAGEEAQVEVEFKTQDEAFSSLISKLDPEYWEIVIRKHPISPLHSGWREEEDQLGESLRFPNVVVIPSDSRVDSFELAAVADLAVTYGSSIGPEIIYFGLAPVLSLCYTNWVYVAPENHAFNNDMLTLALNRGVKKIPQGLILPWAYFASVGGVPFQHFSYNEIKSSYEFLSKARK